MKSNPATGLRLNKEFYFQIEPRAEGFLYQQRPVLLCRCQPDLSLKSFRGQVFNERLFPDAQRLVQKMNANFILQIPGSQHFEPESLMINSLRFAHLNLSQIIVCFAIDPI